MSQFKETTRNAYSGNLATKYDPSWYAKPASSCGGRSTAPSSQQTKAPADAQKSRQERFLEVLRGEPQTGETLNPPQSLKPPSEKTSAVSTSQDAPFQCPYKDCGLGFQTNKDLRKHKHRDHDYCRVCDKDFEDDEAFHQHKINSPKHICCTVCSLDFRSESGRDRHYFTAHNAAHNVKCRRCDVVFARGAALVYHFEKNQCHPKDKQGIDSELFEVQRCETAMVMQNRIKDLNEFGELAFLRSQTYGTSVGRSVVQSSVGGVPIESLEQPDYLNEDDHSTTAESDATTDLLGLRSERNYPVLNATNLAALNYATNVKQRTPKASRAEWPVVGKEKEELIDRMSNVTLDDRVATPVPMMPDLSVAGPSIRPSQTGFSDVGGGSTATKAITLQPNSMTGLWECPFYKCRYRCSFRQDLEAHMALSKEESGHQGYENICPSCLKRFKTASAFLAHLESPTIKCKIRDSRTYSNILHVVSGGHLAAEGRHPDGTGKIVTQKDAGKSPEFIW
ncbi:MAG: hypothetical protein LQ350_007318 [Teloschistes chrysophthalmus]|nr:MAG: hypothetical protein LQ350_007318 [Niorma chrysophthalma]